MVPNENTPSEVETTVETTVTQQATEPEPDTTEVAVETPAHDETTVEVDTDVVE